MGWRDMAGGGIANLLTLGGAANNDSAQAATDQAAAARAAEAERNASIEGRLAKLRALWGNWGGEAPVDPGAAPAMVTPNLSGGVFKRMGSRLGAAATNIANQKTYQNAKEAVAARSKLDEYVAGFQRDVQAQGEQGAEGGLRSALDQNRVQLAKRGLLGGSVDAGSQRAVVGSYIAGRQKAIAQGRTARSSLNKRLLDSRLSAENEISKGLSANTDWSTLGNLQRMEIEHAKGQVWNDAFGEAAGAAGGAIADSNRNKMEG
jgi:hypothetical protein